MLHARQYAELFAGLHARAIQARAEGVLVTGAGREDLITLKTSSGRDRDLIDVGDLLALDEQDSRD